MVEGTAAVLPTLLYTNSCRANLDLVTLHGVKEDALRAIHRLEAVEGDLTSGTARSDGALVGHRLAKRRGIRFGERLASFFRRQRSGPTGYDSERE